MTDREVLEMITMIAFGVTNSGPEKLTEIRTLLMKHTGYPR